MKVRKSKFENGLFLYHRDDDDMVAKPVLDGTYEPFEKKILISKVERGMCVYDVGANIGHYTMLMSQRVGPRGKVVSFEPDPETFEILSMNVEKNGMDNIELENSAVSSEKGTKMLYLSEDNLGDHRLYEHDENRESVRVSCTTIDVWQSEHGRRVDLIKMDTQGYEPFVVHGGVQTIRKFRPIILMEFWPYGYKLSGCDYNEMLDFLEENDYKIWLIDDPRERIIPIDGEYLKKHEELNNLTVHCNLLCEVPGEPRTSTWRNLHARLRRLLR